MKLNISEKKQQMAWKQPAAVQENEIAIHLDPRVEEIERQVKYLPFISSWYVQLNKDGTLTEKNEQRGKRFC